MKWHPWETVPKDTYVLVWEKHCKQMFVGREYHGIVDLGDGYGEADWWMALPEPPALAEQEGK